MAKDTKDRIDLKGDNEHFTLFYATKA